MSYVLSFCHVILGMMIEKNSLITFCIPTDIKVLGGVDLKTLRAIRVLRPLKLVSGVPITKKTMVVLEWWFGLY
ncbi:hypothetical protein BLA29_002380 [Euroglyphus maynei]|uniref:Uncharacterized protein n=1 Tax=Euroglyphus maynei TaxID=6958 RepID=A0A1Y3BAU5_EURMA|nr:hypothetical protein BLA29_002380 [Euroglyphus maynei]